MGVRSSHAIASLLLALVLLVGCHSRVGSANLQAITIDSPPPADKGGPADLELIQGHVSPIHDGQRVVLYSYSDGQWWIQPTRQQPLTKIDARGHWSAMIHLGTQYAALLVPPSSRLPAKTASLSYGPDIIAHTVRAGANVPLQERRKRSAQIDFSGLRWIVRGTADGRGGSLHAYDVNNVWLDDQHHLHMKMTRIGDEWSCAALYTAQPVAYGTYQVTLGDLTRLEPGHVFGIFTWSDAGFDSSYHEMDFEFSRWGNPGSEDAQFAVQPYYLPANMFRFQLPEGPLTLSLEREPERATFTVRPERGKLTHHTFTSGVPSPQGDLLHINFCEFRYGTTVVSGPGEVVVKEVRIFP